MNTQLECILEMCIISLICIRYRDITSIENYIKKQQQKNPDYPVPTFAFNWRHLGLLGLSETFVLLRRKSRLTACLYIVLFLLTLLSLSILLFEGL